MPHQNLIKELLDIRRHCQDITEFTTGMTLQNYLGDKMVRRAMKRTLIIIGVAAVQVHDSHPSIFEGMESLRPAIGVRHRLAHGYDDLISDEVIWTVVTDSIPTLIAEIDRLL